MKESPATMPRVRQRQSLSGRLWLLTTLAVLLSEIVVFLPYIAHERSNWLLGRIEDASIAMLAASGGPVDAGKHEQLLHLTGTEAIRLALPDGPVLAVGNIGLVPEMSIDLRREDLFTRIRRALRSIIVEENRLLEVTANSPFNHTNEVQVLLQEHELSRALRRLT